MSKLSPQDVVDAFVCSAPTYDGLGLALTAGFAALTSALDDEAEGERFISRFGSALVREHGHESEDPALILAELWIAIPERWKISVNFWNRRVVAAGLELLNLARTEGIHDRLHDLATAHRSGGRIRRA